MHFKSKKKFDSLSQAPQNAFQLETFSAKDEYNSRPSQPLEALKNSSCALKDTLQSHMHGQTANTTRREGTSMSSRHESSSQLQQKWRARQRLHQLHLDKPLPADMDSRSSSDPAAVRQSTIISSTTIALDVRMVLATKSFEKHGCTFQEQSAWVGTLKPSNVESESSMSLCLPVCLMLETRYSEGGVIA